MKCPRWVKSGRSASCRVGRLLRGSGHGLGCGTVLAGKGGRVERRVSCGDAVPGRVGIMWLPAGKNALHRPDSTPVIWV